jgi:hypothetical protein
MFFGTVATINFRAINTFASIFTSVRGLITGRADVFQVPRPRVPRAAFVPRRQNCITLRLRSHIVLLLRVTDLLERKIAVCIFTFMARDLTTRKCSCWLSIYIERVPFDNLSYGLNKRFQHEKERGCVSSPATILRVNTSLRMLSTKVACRLFTRPITLRFFYSMIGFTWTSGNLFSL